MSNGLSVDFKLISKWSILSLEFNSNSETNTASSSNLHNTIKESELVNRHM